MGSGGGYVKLVETPIRAFSGQYALVYTSKLARKQCVNARLREVSQGARLVGVEWGGGSLAHQRAGLRRR